MKNKSTILVVLLLIIYTVSFAQQPGDLDGNFDANGSVVTDITSVHDHATSIVVQPDGKIVVTGTSGNTGSGEDPLNFTTVRYQTDGSMDASFGTNGIATISLGSNDRANSVALQADGKIIVGGTTNSSITPNAFHLVRYNQDGTIDSTFNFVSGPFGHCNAIVIQSDGKIVAAGTSAIDNSADFMVARYNTDGTMDNSFGENGVTTTDFVGMMDWAWAVTVQPDGKIVVSGFSSSVTGADVAVVRYTPDGLLDNSFSIDGKVIADFSSSDDDGRTVVIQPDGKILVGGWSPNGSSTGFALVRFATDGTLDNSFGTNGKVTTEVGGGAATSVVLQADGKIILAGDPDFTVVRYHSDGSLDSSFATDGILTFFPITNSNGYSCALQPDGKIVMAGSGRVGQDPNNTGYVVARIISGSNLGVISFSKQDLGLLIYPNPLQENAVIDYTLTNDEKISIDLYDISGRLIQSLVRSERRMKGTHKESLAINASIPSGSYILTLSNGVGTSSIRVVK